MKSCKKLHDNYSCTICDYTTSRKSSWEKHLATQKHKMLTDANKSCKKVARETELHQCSNCGRSYKHKASLCRHRKTCAGAGQVLISKNDLEEIQTKADLYEEHKQDMQELKELVQKVADNGPGTTTINNNLNINIVLETKCKNAMNITDFVNKLHLSLEDLLYTGNNGYIEGVSNIFIKGLQEMEPEKRPIHCADKRGNSLYIKDDNKWEKDGDGKMLDSQIGAVTKKQIDVLKGWEKSHPNWRDSDTETKTYMELVQKIMGGSSDEERMKNHRLIQKKIGKNFNIGDVTDV